MSEWKQEEITMQATAIFTPPSGLMKVAVEALSPEAFKRLLDTLQGQPLTAAVYENFIEEERNVTRV